MPRVYVLHSMSFLCPDDDSHGEINVLWGSIHPDYQQFKAKDVCDGYERYILLFNDHEEWGQ